MRIVEQRKKGWTEKIQNHLHNKDIPYEDILHLFLQTFKHLIDIYQMERTMVGTAYAMMSKNTIPAQLGAVAHACNPCTFRG